MTTFLTIRDLLNLWPTRADAAADMREVHPALPVSTHQVHKWAEKGSIPAKYHWAVIAAARMRGITVTAEQIVQAHAPRPDPAPQEAAE